MKLRALDMVYVGKFICVQEIEPKRNNMYARTAHGSQQ